MSVRVKQSNGKQVKLFVVHYQLFIIKQSIFPFASEQLMDLMLTEYSGTKIYSDVLTRTEVHYSGSQNYATDAEARAK